MNRRDRPATAAPRPPLKDWIHQIAFLTSAARSGDLPAIGAGEVAIAGRSNAGKSSAINTLCQRRRLAFASKTPGRTQALNFFALGPDGSAPRAFLVDAPGYGYAATPHEVRAGWDRLAGRYLQARDSLAGVVLVHVPQVLGPRDRRAVD